MTCGDYRQMCYGDDDFSKPQLGSFIHHCGAPEWHEPSIHLPATVSLPIARVFNEAGCCKAKPKDDDVPGYACAREDPRTKIREGYCPTGFKLGFVGAAWPLYFGIDPCLDSFDLCAINATMFAECRVARKGCGAICGGTPGNWLSVSQAPALDCNRLSMEMTEIETVRPVPDYDIHEACCVPEPDTLTPPLEIYDPPPELPADCSHKLWTCLPNPGIYCTYDEVPKSATTLDEFLANPSNNDRHPCQDVGFIG